MVALVAIGRSGHGAAGAMSNVRLVPCDSQEDAMCATKLLGQHFAQ
jgi:hypothetical protein